MSAEERPPSPLLALEPAVRYYLFLACAGLLTLGLALFEVADILALLTVTLGALGLLPALLPPDTAAARFARKLPAQAMPLLMLLSVIVAVLFGYPLWSGRAVFEFNDLLLCVGLLAYLAGQYRLFGLRTQAVPTDPRPRSGRSPYDEPETWPAAISGPRELKRLGIVLVAVLILGQLGWFWVVSGEEFRGFETSVRARQKLALARLARTGSDEPPYYWERTETPPLEVDGQFSRGRMGMSMTAWRFASLVWLLGVGAILVTSLLGTVRIYGMTADEARMIGQDTLWAETRGEQRRVNRWSAWARRKWFRKTGQQP